MPTTYSVYFSQQRLTPLYDADLARERAVNIAPSQTIARGTILGELIGTDAQQTVVVGANDNTGGTFKLVFGGQTTATIAYNATAAAVQAAFCLLSSVGAGNCIVSGGPASTGTLTFRFVEALGNQPVGAITAGALALTGGTNTLTINATSVVGVTVTPGTFKAYASGNSDGSQVAKAISVYDLVTDSNGNITFGTTAGAFPPLADGTGQNTTAPVYVCGVFKTADLTGLDSGAVTNLAAKFETGNIYDGGVVRIP